MSVVVSVIMPVYNGAKYLKEAVKSILVQTLPNFELIIIDDCSTDGSRAILEETVQHDARIRLIYHKKNLGLPGTLKHGLELARGEYLARMDQDDISLPERLEKQVDFMQTHPEVGICGSWAEIIGERAGEIWRYPCTHDGIYARMVFENTLVHPTVMLRASALRQSGLSYDPNAVHIDDYDLWSRALPFLRFANIPEPLLQYRQHGANTGDLHGGKQRAGRAIIYERFASQLKMEYVHNELVLHEQISSYQYGTDLVFLKRSRRWLEKISRANRQSCLIPAEILDAELGTRWTGICHQSTAQPLFVCFEILSCSLPFLNATGIRKLWRGIKFSLGRIILAKRR